MTLLVTYASKHGSTREVAEALARRLREDERDVVVRPAAAVDDVTPYQGVVLGGSLYFGRWHADAIRFLSRHRRALSKLPLDVFALGRKHGSTREVAEARRQLDKALRKAPEVKPRSVAVFGGVIDPAKLRFPFSRIPASDARDWNAVDAWADEIGPRHRGST